MERPKKKVSDSRVEWTRCVQTMDCNARGTLFGGQLLRWLDEVAGTTAMRHCGFPVTTAAVDNLQFKRPVPLGQLVRITGHVTYVGNTSMEVRTDVYIEDLKNGLYYPVNRAYFTEVAVDENGSPTMVPWGLEPENPGEIAEIEGAKQRIALRKQRRKEGF